MLYLNTEWKTNWRDWTFLHEMITINLHHSGLLRTKCFIWSCRVERYCLVFCYVGTICPACSHMYIYLRFVNICLSLILAQEAGMMVCVWWTCVKCALCTLRLGLVVVAVQFQNLHELYFLIHPKICSSPL